jgi:hypothetical protein
MNHLFVPYELAVLAKEKGFDERCLGYWNYSSNEINSRFITHVIGIQPSSYPDRVCCILYQQLVDWFREKYEVDIRIDPHYDNSRFYGWCYKVDRFRTDEWYMFNQGFYEDHLKCKEHAIKEAFKLI